MCNFFDKRGYPASVVQVGHHRAQQIDRQRHRENNTRIPFTLTFHPHNHAVKSIILKNFKLLQNDLDTGRIISQPPLISFSVVYSKQVINPELLLKCARARFKTCFDKISGPKRSSKITDHFTCTSANAIYCITCTLQKVINLVNRETARRPIPRTPL